MKKIFYLFVSLALVACGSKDAENKEPEKRAGVAEAQLEIEEDFAEKLAEALEDKDGKAVVEAYKWYFDEKINLLPDELEFESKMGDAIETRRKLQREIRLTSLPTSEEWDEIDKLEDAYIESRSKVREEIANEKEKEAASKAG